MNDTDIAWCAGFFDGEGHVSYTRSYPSDKTNHVSRGMRCNVSQSADNVEVLEFFQSIIPLGRITRKYPTKAKDKRIISFATDEVETLFEILKPYLKSKKTDDFKRALYNFQHHSPIATAEDNVRWIKWQQKKHRI